MGLTKRMLAAASIVGLAAPLWAADGDMKAVASADVSGVDQGITGQVTLNQTASGMVLVQIDLSGVPEGVHAVHLHETGDCSAADFKSAGGHLAGDHAHGVLADDGPHPGDMPNMTVGADGILKADVFLNGLDPDTMVMDADGTAFIMHDSADDYSSQPAGDAGSRIACGVFTAAN